MNELFQVHVDEHGKHSIVPSDNALITAPQSPESTNGQEAGSDRGIDRSSLTESPADVLLPSDIVRLKGQNAKILELLRQGPARNVDLVTISLKYTSRISEIREYLKDFDEIIVCRKVKGNPGVTEYRIEKEQK